MIQKLLIVFITGFITFGATAQGKIILQEEKLSSFYPQALFKGKTKGYIFKVGDGDFQPLGRKGESIEAVLIKDEEAYKEFKKFKRKMNSGHVSNLAGLTFYLGSVLSFPNSQSTGEFQTRAIVGLGSMTIGVVTGYLLYRSSIKNLKKSVDIYNGNR